MTHRAWMSALGLLVCGGCGLFIEASPRFEAETESTSASESESESEGNADTDAPPMDQGDIPATEPPQPPWLTVYIAGNPDDADVEPRGPGVLLVGGGMPGNDPYVWQSGMIPGGDIVVLQDEGPDQLTNFLYTDIGGVDSVQTIIVPPGSVSMDPWIAWTVAHAESVLIVGDEPYDLIWKGTSLESAIMAAWDRGAVIGGIDAGLSTIGEFIYPGYGALSSSEALADPYAPTVAIDRDYLSLDLLEGALLEPHFTQQDRMGRLLAFAARVLQDGWSSDFVGVGIDDNTAMVVGPDGFASVFGTGHVYLFRTQEPAATCVPGQVLEFGPVQVARLAAGDVSNWPGGSTEIATYQVIATAGAIEPADPY